VEAPSDEKPKSSFILRLRRVELTICTSDSVVKVLFSGSTFHPPKRQPPYCQKADSASFRAVIH
jgi:hypothetical protein